MNADLEKIRKIRNYNPIFDYKPERIKEEQMNHSLVILNSNFSDLYLLNQRNNIDIEVFINRITENVYIILNMFNKMGVYPDYFYDKIVEMNIKYHEKVKSNTLKGYYDLFDLTNLSTYYYEEIKKGMEKGYYRIQAYKKKGIDDNYRELIPFFQKFNIPYGIYSKEQCRKVFEELDLNHQRIMEKLSTSDDIVEDIECLSRLLFEYMTFYVSLGIDPKECLHEYIGTIEKIGSKGK